MSETNKTDSKGGQRETQNPAAHDGVQRRNPQNEAHQAYRHADQSPWAVRVSDVGSAIGRTQHLDGTFPAPSGIGDDFYGVRPGSDVRVEGDFESIKDGLVLTATVTGTATGRCSRCLKDLSDPLTAQVTAFLPFEEPEPEDRGGDEETDVDLAEEEAQDVYPLKENGNWADMEAVIRDALFDLVPTTPLCKPDCKGLCPLDGVNLNEHPEHHHDAPADPRWAALADLRDRLEKGDHGAGTD
jgi:uncharacterized protein